jgi:hypothetical protein
VLLDVQVMNNVLAVKGAIPGHREAYVSVRDSVRLKHWLHNQKLESVPPVPTAEADVTNTALQESAEEGVALAPQQFLRNPFEIKD